MHSACHIPEVDGQKPFLPKTIGNRNINDTHPYKPNKEMTVLYNIRTTLEITAESEAAAIQYFYDKIKALPDSTKTDLSCLGVNPTKIEVKDGGVISEYHLVNN
jgi:hypothetical protein